MLPMSGVGCVLLQALGGLTGGQPQLPGLQPGQQPPGLAGFPGAPQAPGSTPGGGTPAAPDPLAGGGSAVPPVVSGPGASDLDPPGGLQEGDYDPRKELRTVKVRQYQWRPPRQEANVPYVLDVMSHDPRPDMQTTNMGTWVHETSHGIHAEVRNSAVRSGARAKIQGVYLENGTAAYCYDPQVRQSRVQSFLPQAARGVSRYRTYLTGSQASSWPEALHLLDEWGGYINGGRACVEVYRAGQWREGTVDSVDGMIDLMYFCTGAARVVQADAPQWFDAQGESGKALKSLFAVQTERTSKWMAQGMGIANFRAFHAGQLFRHYQSSPDNADNRRFMVAWMGATWTQRVLGFRE
jgi:hypothetical protein